MSTRRPRPGSQEMLAWVLLALGPAVFIGCGSSDSAKLNAAKAAATKALAKLPK